MIESVIGRPVTRAEALRVARKIIERAENERIQEEEQVNILTKLEELEGRTIRRARSLSPNKIGISFDDDFCIFEIQDDCVINWLTLVTEYSDFDLFQLGLISLHEFTNHENESKKAREADNERENRRLYEELKAKYGGEDER